jgi:hypothetical protein
MFSGEHASMQKTRNQNPVPMLAIKHDVHTALESAQSGPNILAEAAQRRIVCKHLAANRHLAQVSGALCDAPRAQTIVANVV